MSVQPMRPRRRRRWLLPVLLVVGVLVLLCCGGGIWYLTRAAVEVKPATRVADAYLDAIAADDEGAALALVCDSVEAEARHRAFESRWRADGIRSHEVTGVTVTNWNFRLRATARAEVVGTSGAGSVELPLRKHDGEWQVCGD